MTIVDQLSDTVYPNQARDRLDKLLQDMSRFPVKKSQIYGLRQVARQQPSRVKEFARHQRERAERRNPNAPEIKLWNLVGALIDSTSEWSVRVEGLKYAPDELRDTNTPARRRWLNEWTIKHIPAFFERFCAHALYRLGMSDAYSEERER